jgi:hypothetical protein
MGLTPDERAFLKDVEHLDLTGSDESNEGKKAMEEEASIDGGKGDIYKGITFDKGKGGGLRGSTNSKGITCKRAEAAGKAATTITTTTAGRWQ